VIYSKIPDDINDNIDENRTVNEIKVFIRKRMNIKPISTFQLACNGKILPDNATLQQLGINPKKDTIIVVATQAQPPD